MSQSVDIALIIKSAELLADVIADIGAEIDRRKQLRTADGKTCEVDYVVTDKEGASVGVRVNPKTKAAELVPADGQKGKGAKLASKLAQRYAYMKTTEELRQKGYRITKEEVQKDGSMR